MFDTVYAELDCPFCGRQYRYSPMTWEDSEREVKQHKQWQVESRQRHLRGEKVLFSMQEHWAERDGFEDVDAWIAQLDTPDKIEAYRTRRHLGLAEIQTKEFDCVLTEFYIGDEVPQYSGHYFIPEDFKCAGCSAADRVGAALSSSKGAAHESVYVKVWLEIEDRSLKAVLVRDPQTGEPAQEIFKHTPPEPRPPDPHPPLHFKQRGIQAHATYDNELGAYNAQVTYLPEQFTFSGQTEEELREVFEYFVAGYLYLLGKDPQDGTSLHEHLHIICRHLPTDFEPYGEREREAPDCSCGCRHFLELPGKLGMDWGVCGNPASPRAGLLTFEHQGCEQFEARPNV
ncbi:MAG: hypothetical protein QMD04_00135 [Anaerolineales bacterium]|nr:hypothetical protein [Anaerolineales bacterium]